MELIKMSSKGQLVVPKDLRKLLGLHSEDMFLAYGKDDYVIFKKVDLPSLKGEYEALVKVISRISDDIEVTEDIINDEIRDHRSKKDRSS